MDVYVCIKAMNILIYNLVNENLGVTYTVLCVSVTPD